MSNPILTTNGTYGTIEVPACPHCGSLTFRVDGTTRECFVCNKLAEMIFGEKTWEAIKKKKEA